MISKAQFYRLVTELSKLIEECGIDETLESGTGVEAIKISIADYLIVISPIREGGVVKRAIRDSGVLVSTNLSISSKTEDSDK